MRGATFKTSGKQNLITISIHAPHAGRDSTEQNEPEQVDISIHAPHAGRDFTLQEAFTDTEDFNPRAPCGARLAAVLPVLFDPHISIHAPHAGRDWLLVSILCFPRYFNPRAPCGARRGVRIIGKLFKFISIHAPHAGRDSKLFLDSLRVSVISIHAPHAGRDYFRQSARDMITSFQSTRPMRGATEKYKEALKFLIISIHAPHAGRDRVQVLCVNIGNISIHAPHAGRDCLQSPATTKRNLFQSTRPMRGATGN